MRAARPSVLLAVAAVVALAAPARSGPQATPPGPDPSHGPLLVDHERLSILGLGERVDLAGLALDDGETVDLEMERFEVLAPGTRLVLAGAGGERPLADPGVVLLRGSVSGEPGSMAFVGVAPSGVQGYVQRAGSLHFLSTGGPAGAGAGAPGADPIQDDFELRVIEAGAAPQPSDDRPFCGVEAGGGWTVAHMFGGGIAGIGGGNDPPPCRVARIAIETDWEYTAGLFGGDAGAAAAYAITLMAGVGEIYRTYVNTGLEVSFVRLWESDDDPYDPNGAGELHDQFRQHWSANEGGVQRDLAHLLSGRTDLPYGGVAWVGVICNTGFGYGVSAYLAGSFPYPLQHNDGANWDLVVVAHELGHNFGTLHTHDGYSPPIDNCGNGDCTGAENGTIMSYCHTCPGGLTNIALAFHALVQDVIYDFLDSTCDLTASGPNAGDDRASTWGGQPVTVDVLFNDASISCDAADAALTSFDAASAAGGAIALVPGAPPIDRDQLQYTPPAGFDGTDSFGYAITGGVSATVQVEVTPLRAPDAVASPQPGALVSYYALSSPSSLPDFDAMTPYGTDVVPDVDFASTGGIFATSGLIDDVGAVFDGFVTVATDGVYTFYTESDDGSALLIGDTTVVSNDGLHGMQERAGTIGLEAGPHRLRIEFFEAGGGAGLIASIEGPGLPKQPIAAAALSHVVPCLADLSGDGEVAVNDLLALLADWGQPGGPADLNDDGTVDILDLLALLDAWGSCA